jgi:uncharacterized membrane protein
VENSETLAPTPDERTSAMLAQVSQIFLSFLFPLFIYLARRKSKFVAFHALQALILQIILLGGWFATGRVWNILFTTKIAPDLENGAATQSPPWFTAFSFAVEVLPVCVVLVGAAAGIFYGIRAKRGEWAEYPIIGGRARRLAG